MNYKFRKENSKGKHREYPQKFFLTQILRRRAQAVLNHHCTKPVIHFPNHFLHFSGDKTHWISVQTNVRGFLQSGFSAFLTGKRTCEMSWIYLSNTMTLCFHIDDMSDGGVASKQGFLSRRDLLKWIKRFYRPILAQRLIIFSFFLTVDI